MHLRCKVLYDDVLIRAMRLGWIVCPFAWTYSSKKEEHENSGRLLQAESCGCRPLICSATHIAKIHGIRNCIKHRQSLSFAYVSSYDEQLFLGLRVAYSLSGTEETVRASAVAPKLSGPKATSCLNQQPDKGTPLSKRLPIVCMDRFPDTY